MHANRKRSSIWKIPHQIKATPDSNSTRKVKSSLHFLLIPVPPGLQTAAKWGKKGLETRKRETANDNDSISLHYIHSRDLSWRLAWARREKLSSNEHGIMWFFSWSGFSLSRRESSPEMPKTFSKIEKEQFHSWSLTGSGEKEQSCFVFAP